jgi:hypothetical protein
MFKNFSQFLIFLCVIFLCASQVSANTLKDTLESVIISKEKHKIVSATSGNCIGLYDWLNEKINQTETSLEDFWSGLTIKNEVDDQGYTIYVSSVFFETTVQCNNGYASFSFVEYGLSDTWRNEHKRLEMCEELKSPRSIHLSKFERELSNTVCDQIYLECQKYRVNSRIYAPILDLKNNYAAQCKKLLSKWDEPKEISSQKGILEQRLINISREFIEKRSDLFKGFAARKEWGLDAVSALAKYQDLSDSQLEDLLSTVEASGMRRQLIDNFVLARRLSDPDNNMQGMLESLSSAKLLEDPSVVLQIIKRDMGDTFFRLLKDAQSKDFHGFNESIYPNYFVLDAFAALTEDQKLEFAMKSHDSGFPIIAGKELSLLADPRHYINYYSTFVKQNPKFELLDPRLLWGANQFPTVKMFQELSSLTPAIKTPTNTDPLNTFLTQRDVSMIFAVLSNQISDLERMNIAVQNFNEKASESMGRNEKIQFLYEEILSQYGEGVIMQAMKEIGISNNDFSVLGGTALEGIDKLIALNASQPIFDQKKVKVLKPVSISDEFDWSAWMMVLDLVMKNDIDTIKSLPEQSKVFAIEQFFAIGAFEKALSIANDAQKGKLYPIAIAKLDAVLDNVILSDEFLYASEGLNLH